MSSIMAFERRPTHWGAFYGIFIRHLLLHWRHKFNIVQSIAFLVIMTTTFRMAMGYINLAPTMSMGILNTLIVLSLLLASNTLLHDDLKTLHLEQFIMTGVMLEVVLVAKWLAQFLILAILFAIVLPILTYMLSCDSLLSAPTFIVMALLIANTNAILILCNAICLGCAQTMMMAVLSMPLLIPSIILAIISVEDHSYIWLMFALFLCSFPISMISASFTIKSAINY